MVKFIGEYTVKIDDKGRMVLPSAFKSVIPAGEDLRFVVKKAVFDECLEMYTYGEWERQSEELKSRLDFFNRRHTLFWREYMRNRALVGNDFKIEIWAKEKYEASQISGEEFISLADMIPDLQ